MTSYTMKICCYNPRRAAIVTSILSVGQFTLEVIAFSCFGIYIVPFDLAIKVFYAFAAIFSLWALGVSVICILSVSQDSHKWMRPWLVTYVVVTISELVITFVALINLNSLRSIMQFYVSAWQLAQQHRNDQLFVAPSNSTACTPVSNAFLALGGDELRVVALLSQQGPAGLLAFAVLVLVAKNVLNVYMIFVGFVQYRELQAGRGCETNYPQRV